MFENTLELAENKLLLLYIFNKIKFPMSNNQLTQIILENNFINYFTLQQYIFEMVSANLLANTEDDGKNRLAITEKGMNVLSFFENRISKDKLDKVNLYLSSNLDNIKREVAISADYTIDKTSNFVVNLKAMENETTLIDIKLSVASNKQARELCDKWRNNSSELYKKIIQLLITN